MHPELFKIPGTNFAVPGYGAMVLLAFLAATWWSTRRARRVKANPDMVLNFAFISLITSTIGARAFYVLHYWKDQFADQPRRIFDLQSGGFEIYGGVIGAFTCCVIYGLLKRLPLRLYADVIMPSLLLGMGIGRIGCFLFGCCWGGTCSDHLPWAVQFPYGSPPFNRQWEQRQLTIPAELVLVDASGVCGPMPRAIINLSQADLKGRVSRAEQDLAKAQAGGDPKKIASAKRTHEMMQRGLEPLMAHYQRFDTTPAGLVSEAARYCTLWLHPSQLYGAIGPILLALLTNAYFYRRRRHGTVMVLGFALYAVERFVEEVVRSDNPHDTFGLTISQGVSAAVLAIAVIAWLIIRQMPVGSPHAEPWPPKVPQAPVDETAAAAMG